MTGTACDAARTAPAEAAPTTARRGPLAGVRILSLTSVVMGPFATQILAGLGAEIIKIEAPDGDNMRHVGPMKHNGMGHIFLHANRGKKSVVLDLKRAPAREAALRLAEGVDVMISNIRPQAMERLGLGYDEVRARNPRIVYVTCCGFRQSGPYAALPAYDDLIQGATGIPWLMQAWGTGTPCYAPTTLADRVTGLHAVYAVTAALFARERSGEGQAVEVPMFEALTQFVLGDHMAGLTFDPPIGDPGYARLLTSHRRPYETRDGYLCVLIYNDKHWKKFFAAIGEAERFERDARFSSHGRRAEHIDEVYEEVARIMRTRTTAEWQQLLLEVDIPNMPMNSPVDLIADPQLQATGFIGEEIHPSEGRVHTIGTPTTWSGTPPGPLDPAPQLGQDTETVLRQTGFSDDEIRAIRGEHS